MQEVFRKEVKYSVSVTDFCRIQRMLDTVMTPDAHSRSGNGYDVRSLYFDSAWDGDLRDVLDGLLSKQKVRLRVYATEPETCKLEFKCKTGSDSRKKSLTVSMPDARRMIAGRYGFLQEMESPVAKELYGRLVAGAYQPRVVVAYKRIAYAAAINDVRVTYDYDVRASFDPAALYDPAAAFVPVSATGAGVLEVKYNGFLPGYIQTALCGLDSSPSANSKYVESRLAF